MSRHGGNVSYLGICYGRIEKNRQHCEQGEGQNLGDNSGGDFYDNQNLWNGSAKTISQVMHRQVPNPLASGTSRLGTLITNNNALTEAGGDWGAIMIVYLLAA